MRVLVTGGTGFIGAHLVAALTEAGDEVVVLDNLRRGVADKLAPFEQAGMVRLITGDIREREVVRSAMSGVVRVYHAAAQSNVLGAVTDIDYSFTTNVVGTYNVLAAARDEGVERVVFTSSREVYGEVDEIPVAEDHPLNPKNAYGASKLAGEAYCRVFQSTYGLDVSVLRLANVYGPGDSDRVIPIWLDRAARGEDLELYGGQQVLDFVPVALVVAALRRAAEMPLQGQPINIGSGKGTTLLDLAARVRSLPGRGGEPVGAQVGERILPARQVEVTRFVAEVTRMRELLGLEPPQDPLAELPGLWESILLL
jgi:UDP-glucose 4-epimerase